MFSPNSGTRLLKAFLVAVLIGICFASIKAEEKVKTSAVIYTPTICDLVTPYGYLYYAFYCDQR